VQQQPPVSIADLLARGVRLRPDEAVALTREVWRRVSEDGPAPIVPSLEEILITADEGVRIAAKRPPGERTGGEATLQALGTLLDHLLAPVDAPAEFRAPAALRRVVAGARGQVDPPEYTWVEEFLLALQRFETGDPGEVLGAFCRTQVGAGLVSPRVETSAAIGPSDGSGAEVACEPGAGRGAEAGAAAFTTALAPDDGFVPPADADAVAVSPAEASEARAAAAGISESDADVPAPESERVQVLLAKADEALARSRQWFRAGSPERRQRVPRPDVVRHWLREIDEELFALAVQEESGSPVVLAFRQTIRRASPAEPVSEPTIAAERRSHAPRADDLRRLLRGADEMLFRQHASRRLSAAPVEMPAQTLDVRAGADPVPRLSPARPAAAGRLAAPRGLQRHSVTISDIRRARRASGVSLARLAARTGIPMSRLRELEWGYFEQWPGGPEAESWLRLYAREAGIDPGQLLEVVMPELAVRGQLHELPQGQGMSGEGEGAAGRQREPSEPAALVRLPRRDAFSAPSRTVRRAPRWGEAGLPLAAGVLLALMSFGAGVWWSSGPDPDRWNVGREPVSTLGADHEQPSPAPLVGFDAPEVSTGSGTAPAGASVRREAARDADPPAAREPDRRSAAAAAPPAHVAPGTPAQRRLAEAISQEAVESLDDAFLHDLGSDAAVVFSRSDVLPDATAAGPATLEIVNVADGDWRVAHTQLSPDGQYVAFDSDREGVRSVYIANRDGSNVRRASRSGYAAAPAWSPDGRRLVFLQAEPSDATQLNLWMLEIPSGELTRISGHASGRVSPASWFPDGRRLCYGHADQLVIASLDGQVQRRVDLPGRDSALMGAPAVSPDGRRLIIRVGFEGVWLLDLPGGGMRRILGDPTAKSFAWTPDGRRVAFRTGEGEWRMWVMAAARR
jgi:hypothetical protein